MNAVAPLRAPFKKEAQKSAPVRWSIKGVARGIKGVLLWKLRAMILYHAPEI